jgi:hypothetical protein
VTSVPASLIANVARGVLQDCVLAAQELPDPPTDAWRRRWIAVIALLRAVGNVLQNTDRANGDSALRRAIDDGWKIVETTRPPIFWEFIKRERDGVLKAYEFTASQSVTLALRPSPSPIIVRGGGGPRSGSVMQHGPRVQAIYTATMASGAFKGEKPKDVVQRAITWWTEQLDWVDAEAVRIRAGVP